MVALTFDDKVQIFFMFRSFVLTLVFVSFVLALPDFLISHDNQKIQVWDNIVRFNANEQPVWEKYIFATDLYFNEFIYFYNHTNNIFSFQDFLDSTTSPHVPFNEETHSIIHLELFSVVVSHEIDITVDISSLEKNSLIEEGLFFDSGSILHLNSRICNSFDVFYPYSKDNEEIQLQSSYSVWFCSLELDSSSIHTRADPPCCNTIGVSIFIVSSCICTEGPFTAVSTGGTIQIGGTASITAPDIIISSALDVYIFNDGTLTAITDEINIEAAGLVNIGINPVTIMFQGNSIKIAGSNGIIFGGVTANVIVFGTNLYLVGSGGSSYSVTIQNCVLDIINEVQIIATSTTQTAIRYDQVVFGNSIPALLNFTGTTQTGPAAITFSEASGVTLNFPALQLTGIVAQSSPSAFTGAIVFSYSITNDVFFDGDVSITAVNNNPNNFQAFFINCGNIEFKEGVSIQGTSNSAGGVTFSVLNEISFIGDVELPYSVIISGQAECSGLSISAGTIRAADLVNIELFGTVQNPAIVCASDSIALNLASDIIIDSFVSFAASGSNDNSLNNAIGLRVIGSTVTINTDALDFALTGNCTNPSGFCSGLRITTSSFTSLITPPNSFIYGNAFNQESGIGIELISSSFTNFEFDGLSSTPNFNTPIGILLGGTISSSISKCNFTASVINGILPTNTLAKQEALKFNSGATYFVDTSSFSGSVETVDTTKDVTGILVDVGTFLFNQVSFNGVASGGLTSIGIHANTFKTNGPVNCVGISDSGTIGRGVQFRNLFPDIIGDLDISGSATASFASIGVNIPGEVNIASTGTTFINGIADTGSQSIGVYLGSSITTTGELQITGTSHTGVFIDNSVSLNPLSAIRLYVLGSSSGSLDPSYGIHFFTGSKIETSFGYFEGNFIAFGLNAIYIEANVDFSFLSVAACNMEFNGSLGSIIESLSTQVITLNGCTLQYDIPLLATSFATSGSGSVLFLDSVTIDTTADFLHFGDTTVRAGFTAGSSLTFIDLARLCGNIIADSIQGEGAIIVECLVGSDVTFSGLVTSSIIKLDQIDASLIGNSVDVYVYGGTIVLNGNVSSSYFVNIVLLMVLI